MKVRVKGLPPNTEFDFFVIQVPNTPFGLSWYQGDIETNDNGRGRKRRGTVADADALASHGVSRQSVGRRAREDSPETGGVSPSASATSRFPCSSARRKIV
jgi:hypothetical protein